MAEHLLRSPGITLVMAFETSRKWRRPMFVAQEFGFSDLVSSLPDDGRPPWVLLWGIPGSSKFQYQGCIVPALPEGPVVAGTESSTSLLDELADIPLVSLR